MLTGSGVRLLPSRPNNGVSLWVITNNGEWNIIGVIPTNNGVSRWVITNNGEFIITDQRSGNLPNSKSLSQASLCVLQKRVLSFLCMVSPTIICRDEDIICAMALMNSCAFTGILSCKHPIRVSNNTVPIAARTHMYW